MTRSKHYDVVIAGGALAGLTSAVALAQNGFKIALLSPFATQNDGRSTALLGATVDYLVELGVWQDALPKAASMSRMRIIDNTNRLLHAPETTFKSLEIGLDTFGYNILNKDLCDVLEKTIAQNPNIEIIKTKIISARETSDQVSVELDDGKTVTANMVVGADGRNSTVRTLANNGKGIDVRQWQYPQNAIVLNFSHTLPHEDTSTEFHTPSGPFTVVPLGEGISSLVWVVKPQDVENILERKPEILNRDIEEQMHSVLGKTKIITKVQSFPLSGMNANTMASGRFFLVGDAGHVFPPIGAQGYNLGIRDIRELGKLTKDGLENIPNLAKQYSAARKTDITSRTVSVDLFNRSLLTDFLPVQALRSGALSALNNIGPLRKIVMREGITPGLGLQEIRNSFQKITDVFNRKQSHS